MGTVAAVIDDHSDKVRCKNTWGDALYLVVNDTRDAAHLALSLQESLAHVDTSKYGTDHAGMRMALHYGAMYEAHDPVTKTTNFFGTEVSRTARLEPVTPKHNVYVTEAFAAVLALQRAPEFDLHYIGTIAFAKNYGRQPVYRLDRSAAVRSHGQSAKP